MAVNSPYCTCVPPIVFTAVIVVVVVEGYICTQWPSNLTCGLMLLFVPCKKKKVTNATYRHKHYILVMFVEPPNLSMND